MPPSPQAAQLPPERSRATQGLTDDVLTLGPRSRSVRDWYREAVDRIVGADPGMKQLHTALQAVLSIAVAVGLVDLFVNLTGSLQKTGPEPAVSAYNHALLIVSMLLAGILAMLAGFAVTDSSARDQVISTLILPVPMVAAMAAGLALGSYRVLSLVYLVVLMTGSVYVRRWGPRASAGGLVAFNAGFLGFFLHTELALRDIGWLALDLLIGVLASLIVRFTFFRPDPERTLGRMRRSWQARNDRLLRMSIAVLDAKDDRERVELTVQVRRQLVRLNESTLMIDAQLAESVPRSAQLQAQRLFDVELAVSNCARFAVALANICADEQVRESSRRALAAALTDAWTAEVAALRASYAGDNERIIVLAHRLAASVSDYCLARQQLYAGTADRIEGMTYAVFTPAVGLTGGFLPGSVPVSTAASTAVGRGGRLDRAVLPPYLRASIQVAVAATLVVIIGDIVSGPRLYWAVLATFLAFMATTNSGEQVRKAFFRVAGTAIGIVLGDLLVHVTGGHIWSSLLIVLVALFFGIYLIRVNYTFMVIGITVTMSQLYAQLGEFSWNLLLLRLGETAIGVGAVVVTVAVIVPLRPQRVLITAVLLWFRALTAVLDGALDQLCGADRVPLRSEVRNLDAAYAALEATAVPLRRATFGRNSTQLGEIRTISAAARSYARSLAAEATGAVAMGPELRAAAQDFRASVAAIDTRIETGEHGRYVRSAALFDKAARLLGDGSSDGAGGDTAAEAEPAVIEAAMALRDLTLLDGALARFASALNMDVTDHDTTLDQRSPAAQPGVLLR